MTTAGMTITNLDLGSVQLEDCVCQDETLAFPGADTYVEGTILARRDVVTAITPVAGTNTGNGTCTAAAVVAGPTPMVGSYSVICTAATTHGGTFKVLDPNGGTVATGLAMTAGAGAATVFEVPGITFTLTDGSTDFAVADSFTLPVVADGKMVIFATDGLGGSQNPMAVLGYQVAKAGSGDVQIRPVVSGKVRKEKLVIDSGATVTAAILDKLRAAGITAVSYAEMHVLDNQ